MCGDMIENPRESLPGLQGFTTEISDVINLNPNSMPYGSTATGLISISDNRAFLPWNLPSNPNQLSNFPVGDDDNFLPWPSSSSTSTAAFMGNQRRGLPYGFDRPSFLAGLGIYGAGTDPLVIRGSPSFGLQPDVTKLTAQEIMDAKALAASKNHSEAERRRRERINGHLNRLRTLLPNTTKTDKASLLAEVIQHVKELKRQTSEITETSPVPSEVDELTVDSDEMLSDGRLLIRASICCDDRSDLLSDLIKTLKSLRLRTLKAEITTLGRRVRNVLVVTGEGDHQDEFNDENSGSFGQPSIGCIQEALKAVVERPVSDDSGSSKRQRTNLTMVDHMSTV